VESPDEGFTYMHKNLVDVVAMLVMALTDTVSYSVPNNAVILEIGASLAVSVTISCSRALTSEAAAFSRADWPSFPSAIQRDATSRAKCRTRTGPVAFRRFADG